MKVKELIERLKLEDQEAEVILDGPSGGFEAAMEVRRVGVKVNNDPESGVISDTYKSSAQFPELIGVLISFSY